MAQHERHRTRGSPLDARVPREAEAPVSEPDTVPEVRDRRAAQESVAVAPQGTQVAAFDLGRQDLRPVAGEHVGVDDDRRQAIQTPVGRRVEGYDAAAGEASRCRGGERLAAQARGPRDRSEDGVGGAARFPGQEQDAERPGEGAGSQPV
jgi:hypothetical protein